MKRTAFIGLLFCMIPTSSWAHHVVSEAGIAWVEPVTVVEVESSAASFDFGDEFRGDWQGLSVRGEYAIGAFSAALRVPWAHLHFDDGRRAIGLSDVEGAFKYQVVATKHGELLLSTGLGVGLPTGVEEDGLGSGHTEVAPFIAASTQLSSSWVINALAVQKIGLGEVETVHEGPHGSLVSPHADQETALALSTAWLFHSVYTKATVQQFLAWSQDDADSTQGSIELGWANPSVLRVSIRGDVPIAGWYRFDWRMHANLALMF